MPNRQCKAIIWCDRVKHEVQNSVLEVADSIAAVRSGEQTTEMSGDAPGFIWVLSANGGQRQKMLSVSHISSIEPAGESGV